MWSVDFVLCQRSRSKIADDTVSLEGGLVAGLSPGPSRPVVMLVCLVVVLVLVRVRMRVGSTRGS